MVKSQIRLFHQISVLGLDFEYFCLFYFDSGFTSAKFIK